MTRIEPPDWAAQPGRSITGITVKDFANIQRHRDKMLKVVHREIEEYLNNPLLYFDGNDKGFPHRSRLTGEYYVAREAYIANTIRHGSRSALCVTA